MASKETTHDDHHDDHGLAHVASIKMLLGVWGTLMVLTVLTVLATRIDLGGPTNLFIAMVIATVKAGLVCLYFMHLRYDKPLHAIVFLSALLFALLMVGFNLMDSVQYQDTVLWDQNNLPTP